MIRLGVDARDAFARAPRGTGKALRMLLRHLLPLVPEWAVTLYATEPATIALPDGVRTRRIDMRGHRWNTWEHVRLPVAAATDRVDLLHCPSQTSPAFAPCPVVLTVHDVIPLRMGDGWSASQIETFRHALERSTRKARRIIAVSEFTRRDLLATFPAVEAKVDVIPWGVETPPPAPAGDDGGRSALEDCGVRPPFFLAFGGDAPRKNVPRLLEAVARFTREVAADVQLALIGVPAAAAARFRALADSQGVGKHVVIRGYLADEAVTSLLAHAEALVFSSLYEGFGLPILEAMAAGTPVITSHVTSMPEVAGDAAILVDPTDVGAITEAMRACYLNDRVKTDMRRRGLARAAGFTWAATAARTLASYRQALG